MKLSTVIESFITSIQTKGIKSPLTVKRYRDGLREFCEFLNDPDFLDLSIESVESFHQHMLKKGNGQVTCFTKLSAVRSMLRWSVIRNYKPSILPEQVELPRMKRVLRNIPTIEEAKKLLHVVRWGQELTNRDKAIILLLITSGMRISELCGLSRDGIDLINNKAMIVGKGGKQRLVLFSSEATEYLQKYLIERTDKLPYLFIRGDVKTHCSLSPREVQRKLKYFCNLAGIPHYTPHCFRHLFATHLLHNGTDLFSVSRLLGHSSIATTQIYLHASDNELQESHNKVFGKSMKLL